MPDLAVLKAGELVTCAAEGDALGIIEDGAFLVESGKVTWVGTTRGFERKTVGKPKHTVDANGALVTPGFVDPHTHLVFSGSREDELDRKVSGESYVSILQSGGGIARTVRETSRASLRGLVAESQVRLRQLVANGVTTVEVKSGYGHDLRSEEKMLDAIEGVGSDRGAEVVPTFLGLHSKPPGFGRAEDYVDYAINVMLPAIASRKKRPAFSDCFCEKGVFTRSQCEKYIRASKRLGFPCKIHADEFEDSGGASLAAEQRCMSADHLVKSPPDAVESMAEEGVRAVLLPGTSLYSGIPYADARMIAASGCEVALGTDLSPNSWIESPQLVMALACAGLRMTPAQALLGFTRRAASALGRADIGRIAVGCRADFVLHAIPSHRFLPYRVGGNYVRGVFREGREIFRAAHD